MLETNLLDMFTNIKMHALLNDGGINEIADTDFQKDLHRKTFKCNKL